MAKRRAKSSIAKLPPDQRSYIERLLREGRLTLDEMITDLQAKFPGQPAAEVSRSALNRFDLQIEEAGKEIREIEAAASALVGELGEGFGEKSADFLTQAITVVAVKAAMRAKDNPDLGTKEAKDLAQMAKNAMDAKRMNVAQRQLIRAEARDALLREQESNLKNAVKEGGLSDEMADVFRKKILGIG